MINLNRKTISAIIFAVVATIFLFQLPRIGEDVRNEEIVVNQYPFTGQMAY